MKKESKVLPVRTKVRIEADKKDPATITDFVETMDSCRVRFTLPYDQCSVSRGGNGSLP